MYNLGMSDLKKIIAKNLTELRKSKKYTQQDIGDMVQYSDKAVSKWEKGESLPDIDVLYQLCNIYGVTLDYLTHEGSTEDKKDFLIPKSEYRNKIIITALFSSFIWMAVIIVYVYLNNPMNKDTGINFWPIFIWAIPLNCVLLWFLNMKWGRRLWFIIIASIFVWSLITSFFIQIMVSTNYENFCWMLFLIGVPIQIALVLLSQLKHY